MHLLQRFKDYIRQEDLFREKDKLLLAVSGGVDSAVLCDLIAKAGYNFMIAHCNFQLRGEESSRDEAFVRTLGTRYEIPVWVKKFETANYASEKKIGIQQAARELRYAWFDEIINHPSLTYIAPGYPVYLVTAHHADDNIETVLMNFFRGTGLRGLEGIPAAPGHIRRPLLSFWKEELIEFASENALAFVEDSSNSSSRYTRNFFRNEIIPLVAGVYPQVKSNLQDNITRFREIQRLYAFSVAELKKKLCKVKNGEVHIGIKALLKYNNRALIFEIISEYGFSEKQIDEVIRLCSADSGKFIRSFQSNHRIIKFRDWLIVSRNDSTQADTIVIEEGTKKQVIQTFTLHIEPEIITPSFQVPASPNVACLDARNITFPLLVRKWKQGDYFYPLGMRKKKKLARFFIDQKLSKTDREKLWVVEMNKKILWVVGLRIDERFKITTNTKNMIRFIIKNSPAE